MIDFMRDPVLDKMIEEIIDIFKNVEGVELVRLNGLVRHLEKITGGVVDKQSIANVIQRLFMGHVIEYQYVMFCPHCGEITYQIKERDITTPKLCDTCNTFYVLNDDTLLIERRLPRLG